MKRRRQSARRCPENAAYREAFDKLDAALEQNTQHDNTHKIRLLRIAMFGEVDKLAASGTVKLPE